jgi:hypothetical protein
VLVSDLLAVYFVDVFKIILKADISPLWVTLMSFLLVKQTPWALIIGFGLNKVQQSSIVCWKIEHDLMKSLQLVKRKEKSNELTIIIVGS